MKIRAIGSALLFVLLTIGIAAPASRAADSSDAVENAILTGDWPTVYQLLQDPDNFPDTALAALLRGQACLITRGDCPPDISRPEFLTATRNDHFVAWLADERAKHPDNQWILYLSGIHAFHQANAQEALAYLNRAIELAPRSAPMLVLRATVYLIAGFRDPAYEDLKTAHSADTTSLQPYIALGAYHLAGESYDSAIFYLDKAEALGYHGTQLYYQRGLAYAAFANTPLVIADLSEAIRLDPASAGSYLMRGTTYLNNDLQLLAYYDYRKYFELAPPEKIAAAGEAGDIMTRLVDTMTQMIQQTGEEHFTYDAMLQAGDAYRANKDWWRAMAFYVRAMEIDPARYEPYMWRGYVLDELQLPRRALADLDRAVAMAPDEAQVYKIRARSYLNRFIKSREADTPEYTEREALADFDRALALQPDDFEGHYYRGLTHDLADDTSAAILDFNYILEHATPEDTFKVRQSQKYLDSYR